jgi:hypothetical protein
VSLLLFWRQVARHYARTASDSLVLSDAATRTVAAARTALNSVDTTDTMNRSTSTARSAADGTSFDAVATRVLALVRTASAQDAEVVSATRSLSLVREADDVLAMSATADRRTTASRSATVAADALEQQAERRADYLRDLVELGRGGGATADRVAAYSREADEATAQTDSARTASMFLRTAFDTAPGQVVSATTTSTFSRTGSESLSASSQRGFRQVSYVRSFSESLTEAVAVSFNHVFGRSTSESMAEDASSDASLMVSRTISEQVRETITVATNTTFVRTITGIGGSAHLRLYPARRVDYNRPVSEQVVQSETVTRLHTHTRAVSEALGVDEFVARQLDLVRSPTELAVVLAVAQRTTQVSRTIVRIEVSTQRAIRQVTQSRSAADEVSVLTDSASFVRDLRRTSLDQVTTTDVASRLASVSRLSNESVLAVGTVRRTTTVARLVEALVQADATATQTRIFLRRAQEAVSLVDDASRVATYPRTVSALLVPTETAQRTISASRLTVEAPTFDLALIALITLRRTATDSLAAMIDTAVRERIYRLPRSPFEQPFDLDMDEALAFALTTAQGVPMELVLSVSGLYLLEGEQDTPFEMAGVVQPSIEQDLLSEGD